MVRDAGQKTVYGADPTRNCRSSIFLTGVSKIYPIRFGAALSRGKREEVGLSGGLNPSPGHVDRGEWPREEGPRA